MAILTLYVSNNESHWTAFRTFTEGMSRGRLYITCMGLRFSKKFGKVFSRFEGDGNRTFENKTNTFVKRVEIHAEYELHSKQKPNYGPRNEQNGNLLRLQDPQIR